jgi:hypothetical protein
MPDSGTAPALRGGASSDALLANRPAPVARTGEWYARWGWTAALYLMLLWLAWPSLSFDALPLADREQLDAFAPLSLLDAIGYVGDTPLRPGENLFLWLVSHAGAQLPWRLGLLVMFLLTTVFIQHDAAARGGSWIVGLGGAACFSINPTTFSVVCSLSAAHVGLCGLGLIAYFGCAWRALDRDEHRGRYVVGALAGLAFALAFYELAVLAPIVIAAYQRLLSPRGVDRQARRLYLGSAAIVAVFVLLQIGAADVLHLWAGESAAQLLASAGRYASLNFWAWLYPFETFGVLIPDDPGGHAAENIVGWLFVLAEAAVLWKLRRSDPLSTFGGVWGLVFLVPAGALLHFDGSAIAQHHVYITMIGAAYPLIHFATRFLERFAASLERAWVRVVIGTPIVLFLFWSLIPLIAECHQTVKLWGNEEQLYLTTLKNYPDSAEALGRVTRDHLARARASETSHAAEPWEGVLDAVLLRPPRDSAATLIRRGHELLQRARYVEAGSAFARALRAGPNPQQELDAGRTLVVALMHTDQRASAGALLARLRREYPTHAELGAITP